MRIRASVASSFSFEAEGRVTKETMQFHTVSSVKKFNNCLTIFCHRVRMFRI